MTHTFSRWSRVWKLAREMEIHLILIHRPPPSFLCSFLCPVAVTSDRSNCQRSRPRVYWDNYFDIFFKNSKKCSCVCVCVAFSVPPDTPTPYLSFTLPPTTSSSLNATFPPTKGCDHLHLFTDKPDLDLIERLVAWPEIQKKYVTCNTSNPSHMPHFKRKEIMTIHYAHFIKTRTEGSLELDKGSEVNDNENERRGRQKRNRR